MADTSSSTFIAASNDKIVPLNQDIGYLLMKYLNGLNVINFMEAVNGSEQFSTIEITEEQIFFNIFLELMTKKKTKVNVPYLHFYLDTCFIDDEGYLCPEQYDQGEPPILRLFIHPTFTVESFEQLCCTYKTSSFQCYTRLLSLNTHSYVGNLILVDYFNYKHSIGCTRELNAHEKSLFKECSFFRSLEHNILNEKVSIVPSIADFMTNFETRFKCSAWIQAIDFNKFHISGGCIVNSLCNRPFPNTATEEVDINFHGNSFDEFDDAVANVFIHLTSILSMNGHHLSPTLLKKSKSIYNAILPSDIKLRFNFKDVPENENPVSYVLHCSDLDISQVAFTGSRILCTFAFLQAVATKSFICYTMHGGMERNISDRIIRYCQRGFIFLEPKDFDNVLYIDIIARTVLVEEKEETREIMNDDGEIQTITITYQPRQLPFPNVDPHRLQETFIKRICSQKS